MNCARAAIADATIAAAPGDTQYIGRFAPSPTGPLHAGSLVAALASWLDARAHGGRWLVRIEDVDTPRCLRGMDQVILEQLARFGLQADAAPLWQSSRSDIYQRSLDQLIAARLAYRCSCSRKDIEAALKRLGQPRLRHGELVYPGTCRPAAPDQPPPGRARSRGGLAWRLRTDFFMPNQAIALEAPALTAIKTLAPSVPAPGAVIHWNDRRLGAQQQAVQSEVGDFVLQRADGCFSYQLAVVVDDAAQGITDVVRGEDLADNTARQILLQRALGLPTPRYLHLPLVTAPNGDKLSKQSGAQAINTSDPLNALNHAARFLGLAEQSGCVPEALDAWIAQWQNQSPGPMGNVPQCG